MAEDDFSSLVGGDVKPLKSEQRVVIRKSRADEEVLQTRREAAQAQQAAAGDPLASEPAEMCKPEDLLSFKRPGIQHGVFKNLRLGKYVIDARLDLHKLNVEKARLEVYRFILDCVANDVRTALITHGKGEGRERQAVLKSHVAHWLPQLEAVLAFHSAQKHHGGYGATYVLLKKSDSAKLKNKQRHERS